MEFIQDQDFNPKKNLLVSSEDRNRIPSFVSFQFFRYPAFLISVWIIIGFFIQEYINLSLLMIIVLIGLGFFGQILLHKYSRWFCLASCLFWLMIAGFIHYLAYQIPIDAFRLVQGTKVTYQGTIQPVSYTHLDVYKRQILGVVVAEVESVIVTDIPVDARQELHI